VPELFYDDLSAVPEGLKEVAKPQVDAAGKETGKLVVNVVPKAKLDEFREMNTTVVKERDELKKNFDTYKGIVGDKPDDFLKNLDALRAVDKRVKDGELVANTSLDEAINARTKEMRGEYDGKIKSLEEDRNQWRTKWTESDTRLRRFNIAQQVTAAILDKEVGARPDAANDILERAYRVFRVDDNGNMKPFDGDQVIYGADGASPMTPKEWLGKLKETAPYYFQGSSGGGAGGNGGGNPGGGRLTAEQIANLTPEQYRKARADKLI